MRRSASEIINDLETRIAQLEKESEYKSTFDLLHDRYKKSVKNYDDNNRSMRIKLNEMSVDVDEASNDPAVYLAFEMRGKTFADVDQLTKTFKEIEDLLKKIK